MLLAENIIKKIKNDGPISFKDYMEMALYYPGHGYYNSPKLKLGRQGDYYTTPELTSIFATLLAKQIEEMWNLLNKQPFTIVEYGAGTGILCRDILDYLKTNKYLYRNLRYCIIEKSPFMIGLQKEVLTEKVSWYSSINEIPNIVGCILSNEVLDNFAVHQVIMKKELMEIFVDYENEFTEILLPASSELKDYFTELQVTLPEDHRAEVNLQALQWLKEIAGSLRKGFIITIDYGASSEELYKPSASKGTLLCYNHQQINEKYYCHIGEQDITAHVNFSALQHWGKNYGIECCGYTLQTHFLHALGLVSLLKNSKMQFYPLMMDTATRFKVLIQQKGLQQCFLTGMQFAFRSNSVF